MSTTAAELLADHFVSLQFADIPQKLIDDSTTLTLDYLGVAFAGSQTSSGRIAARFATEPGGREETTLIGNGARVPAVHGAFANAIASHSVELDDVDVLALFHFSPLPRGVSCLMTLETDSGAVHRSQVDHPRGSIANPMTPDDMDSKVHMLADGVIGRGAVTELIDAVGQITTLPRIDRLTRLFHPEGLAGRIAAAHA